MHLRFSATFLRVILGLAISVIFVSNAVAEEPAVPDIFDRSWSVDPAAEFTNFSVGLGDSLPGAIATYVLEFDLPLGVAQRLERGGLIFKFPENAGLDGIVDITVTDTSKQVELSVVKSWVYKQYLIVSMRCTDPADSSLYAALIESGDKTTAITMTISSIQNPDETGDYHLTGLAYDRHLRVIAGPTQSDSYAITEEVDPVRIVTVQVVPDDDFDMRAGESVEFSATAFDNLGQIVEGVEFQWRHSRDSDPIGTISGSTLQADLVGQLRVEAFTFDEDGKEISGQSGLITVLPGPLAKIELSLNDQQVVHQRLIPSGDFIALFDSFGNPKADFDISANPIDLFVFEGELIPNRIDDPEMVNGHLITLGSFGMFYSGPTGSAEIRAEAGGVVSNNVEVSYSGYEVLWVKDSDGNVPTEIPANTDLDLLIAIQNNGNLAPHSAPFFRVQYESIGDIVNADGAMNANGIIDTISLTLPGHPESPLQDNIFVQLHSLFEINGATYQTIDSFSLPVEIVPKSSSGPKLIYFPGSLSPTFVSTSNPVEFEFTLDFESNYSTFTDPIGSFTLSADGLSASSSIDFAGRLNPGPNNVTATVNLPVQFAGKTLTPTATVRFDWPGVVGGYVVDFDFYGETVSVPDVISPSVQIVTLDVIAPNVPYVNTGQSFQVVGEIDNLFPLPIRNLPLELSSDGGSIFESIILADSIPGNGSVMFTFEITAAELSGLELFTVHVADTDMTEIPAIDNSTAVTIQTPADLELVCDLFGDSYGVVEQGQSLALTIALYNSGQAQTSSGRYVVQFSGGDFGFGDSITGEIEVGQPITIQLHAPDVATNATITVDLLESPKDLNTDRSTVPLPEKRFELIVLDQTGRLLVESEIIGTSLLTTDRPKDIGLLTFTNLSENDTDAIRFDRIGLRVQSDDFPGVNGAELFSQMGTGLYEDGELVAASLLSGDRLTFLFGEFVLHAGETRSVAVRLEPRVNQPGQIRVTLDKDDITAEFINVSHGDHRPEPVSNQIGLLIDRTFSVRSGGFQNSVAIQNSPFNPEVNAAIFSYQLDEPSAVEFRVFTLTGRQVCFKEIPAGSQGAAAGGEQFIEWNGCNGTGDIVLNGVYVVSIKIVRTGEEVRRKIAVVK